jgi:hypothetical protein
MQGYSKGSMGPSITVHFNGYVGDCMQGYSKGIEWPFMPVHYNG